jgi:hypothetical protein
MRIFSEIVTFYYGVGYALIEYRRSMVVTVGIFLVKSEY